MNLAWSEIYYDLIGHLIVKLLSLITEFISNITEIPLLINHQ